MSSNYWMGLFYKDERERTAVPGMPQERSSGAVVFRTERGRRMYLLLHYESKHWDFTKGNVEKGESDEQTARRECQEETGISDIVFVPGFEERIEYFYRRKRNEKVKESKWETIHKEVVFLLAQTKTKDVTLSYEHIGFEWLPYDEALQRLTYDNAKDILKKAEAFLAARGTGRGAEGAER